LLFVVVEVRARESVVRWGQEAFQRSGAQPGMPLTLAPGWFIAVIRRIDSSRRRRAP
jgi:hypothetical protein